jgi:hypothetical protein
MTEWCVARDIPTERDCECECEFEREPELENKSTIEESLPLALPSPFPSLPTPAPALGFAWPRLDSLGLLASSVYYTNVRGPYTRTTWHRSHRSAKSMDSVTTD